MIRTILILIAALMVSACETTRETKTNNIGTSSISKPLSASFDKARAAEKRVNMGLTYLGRANFTRAKFHLDRALEYNPDSENVHYALGLYFQRIKEFDKADNEFDKALDLSSKDPKILNAYGAFLCDKGEYAKADKMFHKAIEIPTYSDVARAYFNVGFCALKQNHADKAEAYFRKALIRDRDMSGALIEMAKLEFLKSRYDRAKDYLRRYEEKTQVSAESAWLGLRVAHYLRDKDSIAKYGTILEQSFPDSEETAKYLNEKKRWM